MWPFNNSGTVDQKIVTCTPEYEDVINSPIGMCPTQPANPFGLQQQLVQLQNSPPTVGGLGQYAGTSTNPQYQPIHVGPPPNPAYMGYPYGIETESASDHRRMKDLILNSENTLILELTKMCADVTDEAFRKIILNRIEAAEGRKLAVELADLN